MAYRRFTNLHEKIWGDLISKVNEGIECLDFKDRPCNCSRPCYVNGACAYKEKCRRACVVYRAKCKVCEKSYVGVTQDFLKKRMTQHFADVSRLTATDKPQLAMDDKRRSDTFASHFAKHFPRNCTAQQLRENIEFDILWQGNLLSCVKTFQTQKCRLCTMECLFILKLGKKHNLINRRDELYGSCRQNPKLHRFNTDDPPGEKVETDRPIHRTPPGFIFDPVGQTLAAVRRYSKQQRTSLSFTGQPRPMNSFPYHSWRICVPRNLVWHNS